MPLARVASILAAVVLRERLGPRRIVAIAAGLTGTLLILKPGTESFSLVGLMPVGAGLCYAMQILVTRRLCREESPVTLTIGVAITFLTVGVIGLVALLALARTVEAGRQVAAALRHGLVSRPAGSGPVRARGRPSSGRGP